MRKLGKWIVSKFLFYFSLFFYQNISTQEQEQLLKEKAFYEEEDHEDGLEGGVDNDDTDVSMNGWCLSSTDRFDLVFKK